MVLNYAWLFDTALPSMHRLVYLRICAGARLEARVIRHLAFPGLIYMGQRQAHLELSAL